MTEVIKVTKPAASSKAPTASPDETERELPPAREVIRVGKRTRIEEGGASNAGQTDPESAGPATATTIAKEHRLEASRAGRQGEMPQEVAVIAAVFSDCIKALDLVAAEQAKWLVGIAVCLAEAARSPMAGDSGSKIGSVAASHEDTLVARLEQTAVQQLRTFTAAQARFAETALVATPTLSDEPRSAAAPAASGPVEIALSNMISNLNLAQQNAVRNQQAMNTLAQAAIAAGLSRLYGVPDGSSS